MSSFCYHHGTLVSSTNSQIFCHYGKQGNLVQKSCNSPLVNVGLDKFGILSFNVLDILRRQS